MNFVDLHYILYKMYVISISFAIFEYQGMVKTKQKKIITKARTCLSVLHWHLWIVVEFYEKTQSICIIQNQWPRNYNLMLIIQFHINEWPEIICMYVCMYSSLRSETVSFDTVD